MLVELQPKNRVAKKKLYLNQGKKSVAVINTQKIKKPLAMENADTQTAQHHQ
jgi:hypothetical protein